MDISFLMTKTLAVVTFIGNIATVVLLIVWLIRRPIFVRFMRLLGSVALPVGFLLSAASTFGSLVYSEVVGFPACILCWIQRVFMYPQAIVYFLAVWRREQLIAPYGFALSVIGGGVALYQWVKDMIHVYTGYIVPCPAVSGLPSCDTIYINEFGYITIPMLALNAFILIGITMWAGIRYNK